MRAACLAVILTLGWALMAPAQKTLQTQKGEVIVVTGEVVCFETEKKVEGMCVPSLLFDWLFGGGPASPPGTGFPDPPGGGGSQPSPPGPKQPTAKECEAAQVRCSTKDAIQVQRRCLAEAALHSSAVVNDHLTCHGNTKDLVGSITIDLFVPPPFQGLPSQRACRMSDLDKPGGKLQTDIDVLRCVAIFRRLALDQCMNDFHGATVSSTDTHNGQLSLADFAQFGFDSSITVSVEKPGGTGYDKACAALRAAAHNKCREARDACLLKAQGGALLTAPPPSLEEIIQRIDRARVQFLADWSTFLKEENVGSQVQTRAQEAFARAQVAFRAAWDDLITLHVLSWVIDPQTGQMGTPEVHQLLVEFLERGDLERRAATAERVLEGDLVAVFGNQLHRRFERQVWPGIITFGVAEPMLPGDVFAPLPLSPGKP